MPSIPSRICIVVSFALLMLSCFPQHASSQVVYPFELPDEIKATLDINTSQATPVNPMILGLNCNWPENLYGKVGYNHADAQKLIKKLNPSSLRFPHGVWANFYDWESDGRRITDNYKTPYDSSVKNHPDLKYGFDGFHKLHQQLGFDVLLTFNVNYDSPEKAVRRLADRRDKGFDVKWVELGNEPFWKTQRSNAIADVEKYVEVSKAHAAALKTVSPDLLISIPVHWRTAETNPWNLAVKKHHYYDAITLHKHMRFKSDTQGAAQTLAAREHTHTRTSFGAAYEIVRGVFEGSEIYDCSIDSTTIGDGLDAVSAEAVVKDGRLIVFAINKTTQSVPFGLNIDGAANSQPVLHRALAFDGVKDQKTFTLDDDGLTTIDSKGQQILLPPLSINRIDVQAIHQASL